MTILIFLMSVEKRIVLFERKFGVSHKSTLLFSNALHNCCTTIGVTTNVVILCHEKLSSVIVYILIKEYI